MPDVDQYESSYYEDRYGNDSKRLASFQAEKRLLEKYVQFNEPVCDVGCSTGEFLESVDWQGPRFGMEVSEAAIRAAKQVGIDFSRTVLTESDFFGLVVFRGTIQHLPDPFNYIEAGAKSLKPGGHMAFLMTPNAGSLIYRLFGDLPALDPERNYFIPSEKTLANVLQNAGLRIVLVEKPYLGSPYAKPISDSWNFAVSLVTVRPRSHAFPGNMMNIIARKDR